MKKTIAILLCFLMTFNTTISLATTYDGDNILINDWDNFVYEYGLPSGTPQYSTDSHHYMFNKELFLEKKLIVYGDYADVKSRFGNDFKAVSGGYYSKGGKSGEYRYHGFDKNGGKITNQVFPNDSTSTKPTEEKQWIYKPWESSSIGYDLFKRNYGNNPSDWTKDANENQELASQITNSFSGSSNAFDIQNVYPTSQESRDVTKYMNVTSMPTPLSSGEGVMYRVDEKNRKWYQTFSLDPINDKLNTPVKASIESITSVKTALNGDVTMEVKLKGHLQDEAYYVGGQRQKIELQTHYYREDVKNRDPWSMNLYNSVNGDNQTVKGTRTSATDGLATFKVTFTGDEYKSAMDESGNFNVNFSGSATVNFNTGDYSTGYTDKDAEAKGSKREVEKVDPVIPPVPKPPKPVEIEVDAPYEILDVWQFPLSITVEGDVKSREVILDGKTLSEAEADSFLNGEKKFPEIREDRIYDYKIIYISEDDLETSYSSFVMVRDSVPRAQVMVLENSGKINRRISVSTDSSITGEFLKAHSTISISSFIATSSSGAKVYFGKNTDALKEFLVKEVGTVNVTAVVSNEYGSRTYTQEIYAGKDYKPNIDAVIWNNVLARDESLDVLCEGTSLDGDTIEPIHYDIYYDEDKDADEVPEKLVDQGIWDGTNQYSPEHLGKYKIVFTTTEQFGEPTIDAFINPEDYQTVTVSRDFFVDNLTPMTKIYTDIEYDFPKVDVAFLVDENYETQGLDYLKTHRVDTRNQFTQNEMKASLDIWDLHTYVYKKTATYTSPASSSRPSNTYFYSVDGYNGTLSLFRTDDNSYEKNKPYYTTERRCHTETVYGKMCYYDDGVTPNPGASGGLWCDYHYPKGTKKVCENVSVKHNHYVTYYRYVGHYSGEVTKYVKQTYNPDYDIESKKYVVYFADNKINNQADYDKMKNISKDGLFILVGDESLRGLANEDYFIPYTEDTQSIIDQVIAFAKSKNKTVKVRAVLQNEAFNMAVKDDDVESDPLLNDNAMQYVQDPNYFDNPTGKEDIAVIADEATGIAEGGFTNTIVNHFANVGKFIINRIIKDKPIEAPEQGGDSNKASLSLYVHRKPIADFDLDWTYNTSTNLYDTIWVDKSYDLDFEFSDPENKGIVERKIKYRKDNGQWIYEIPDQLKSGSYDLEYVVQDNFGVWSDVKSYSFVLTDIPPVQILDGKVKPTLDQKFTIDAIPASEDLTFYDAETRYPTTPHLEYGIYDNAGNLKTPLTSQYLSDGEIVSGQDIYWTASNYKIPETLPDGVYDARLYAVDENIPLSRNYKAFPIVVKTPINLEVLKLDKLVRDYYRDTQAQTSKYASQVEVTFFYGTSFQKTVNMTLDGQNGDLKTWSLAYKETRNIPEGTYTARYTAMTPNGNVETKDKSFEFIINAPPTVTFESYIPKGKLYVGHHLVYTVLPKDENDPQVTLDYYVKKPGENYTKVGTYTQVKVGEPFTLDPVVIDQAGDYGFKIIATDPPGDTGQAESVLETNARGIGDFKIEGAWNHWRGQIDLYGNRMIVMPHRFLSYEKVYFTVTTDAIPDAVSIRFSPELEAMTYTDKLGNVYDYKDDIYETVNFPLELDCVKKDTDHDTSIWKGEYILPLADSTMGFDDVRLGDAYNVEATAHYINDPSSVNPTYDDQKKIEDIDITGNIYDMIEIQPTYHE